MDKDILRLAGVLNENDYYSPSPELKAAREKYEQQHNRFAQTTGMYQAMAGIVRRKLETAVGQLESPEWTREEDGRLMLEHLEKAVREALEEMNRIEKRIEELGA
jgi:hypothetical protein